MIHHTDCDRSNAFPRGGCERLHLRGGSGQCRIRVLGVGVMRALDRHKPKARPAPRWKAPKVYRFRLSSTFWRAVASPFPANTATTCNLTLDEIEAAIERSRAVLKNGHFSVPNANSLHAV